ncbi:MULTISPECIES: tetratricopeptide repeat protein [unclassified Campylobacter]|uniref:tetratricopeptide repeat protein n=1 Tax=unclassified Campylobacter TaxID=2593542 RepID=UPI0022E9DE6C|nr:MULTISPECIES: tetratricopeptide repeat protein [unclassified Campylobacter]MDA3054166.1 tetratricopeptide repeat protein [Campylobacter sp. VBCF_07 NA4]MDA3060857.1 tetratricopeptide repeat protein [Campylobacter sp. VBCF_02 NA5]MDA3070370.1 tetratricopeptide repeat protein [Campylobacter sp. VBCF_08 NA3]WBR53681.1 tetratricopeptide repeat protein [Campylobacter sp. VBCF_01 NA2]
MNDLLKKLSPLHQAYIQQTIDTFGSDHYTTAYAYYDIGKSNKKSGDYNIALACFEAALNIQEKVFDNTHSDKIHPDIARSYVNIAECHANLGNSEKALEYYNNAIKCGLEVLETQRRNPEKKDISYIADIYVFLGVAYSAIKDFDNAIEYKLKALNVREMILDKNSRDIIESCLLLAMDYSHINDNDNTIKYCQKVLQMLKESSDKDDGPSHAISENLGLSNDEIIGATYGILGRSYFLKNEYSKALEIFEKVLDISERLGDIDSVIFTKQLIAEIKQKL